VIAVGRGQLDLELTGPAVFEPAPGEDGASLPYVELAVSLPRGSRAEELIDHAVQLGLAAWTPLLCERTQGGARELSGARLERLDRAAAEACKQSRALWLPKRRPAASPTDLAAREPTAQIVLLAPRAAETLLGLALRWRQSDGWPNRSQPLVIAVGPEGGFTDAEEGSLRDAGAVAVSLGPHILRIETAAAAALATVVQVFCRRNAASEPTQDREVDTRLAQNDMRSRSDT
jgi:16S rRNA (uracil1498-N3)-methyltransferase